MKDEDRLAETDRMSVVERHRIRVRVIMMKFRKS
jgi:hypothetical protein